MEIGDVPAALKKVREFIDLLEVGRGSWLDRHIASGPWRQRNSEILERLPLILQIAGRADAELPAKLQAESRGYPYTETLKATRQLAGRLESADEAQQILGPIGPKLAAANLHPWIWNAAVRLWDNGHRREAVQAAAQALFDHHLPAKLGVPPARSAKDLASQAFSTQPPAPGNPRLRLDVTQTLRRAGPVNTRARSSSAWAAPS